MICINPYLLVYDVGFQLSFLATLGLILLSSHLEKVFSSMPKIINLREFLVATVAAQIFVMPILLYQIGAFSVVAVLVNLIVLPMVPVAMFLSFVVGMVGFLSFPLSQFFGFFAYWSLAYILHVAVFFAQLPFASFVVPAFPFVFVIISYALLGWLLFYIHARTKRPLLPQHTAVLRETSDETIPIQKTLPIFFR
jgi:competence protein ComEC